MPKLNFTHTITELRNHGESRVNQTMTVTVDYYPSEDSFEVLTVDVHENGIYVCEISKLLHKAEGNPLNTMVDEIDWRGLYEDSLPKRDDLFEQACKIVRDDAKKRYGINLK